MKPIICKRVHLSPYKCLLTFYLSTFYHQKIGTRKQHIQIVEIFRKYPISNFSKAKCVFDDFKSMFYFATYSGFSVFNIMFPVNRMIRYTCGRLFGRRLIRKSILRKCSLFLISSRFSISIYPLSPNVAFHPEFPYISLFGLIHFRIPFLLCIFG